MSSLLTSHTAGVLEIPETLVSFCAKDTLGSTPLKELKNMAEPKGQRS